MNNRVVPKLFTNTETAELLGIRPNTLEQWRLRGGIGPKFLKIGRSIRYSEADVIAWLNAQTCTSTSQYPSIGHNKITAPAAPQTDAIAGGV